MGKQTFITNSVQQTEQLAEKIAKTLSQKSVLAFFGGLGAGKTTFIRGLGKSLGIKDELTSPTYTIMHEYLGKPSLVHFDMYRVHTLEDLETTGFFDYIDTDCIAAIEWSENISLYLPEDSIHIEMEMLDDTTRKITITTKE